MTFPIKKKILVSIVQSMEGFSSPNVQMEQYITDAISTVDFLYYVAVDNHDIFGKIILDLGAGTGRLGLTSLLMGANTVISVEIDPKAIQVLEKNAQQLDLTPYMHIVQMDVAHISDSERTNLKSLIRAISTNSEVVCIMNPPFGVQSKNADRPFLRLAMELCDKIYSIHLSNAKNRSFLQRFAQFHGWEVASVHSQKMILIGNLTFHKKKQKEILTDIYKMIKKAK